MHAVIETPTYLADAKAAGLSDEARAEIVAIIARNPRAGDIIVGTGGVRKVRVAGRGKGKSGGYRVVSYVAADDVPVFLLALIDKDDRADLSQADKNDLRSILATLADDYRTGMAHGIATRRRRRS